MQTITRGGGACCEDVGEALEARFFKALGDANRVAILADLAECGEPRTVSRIADGKPVDISVVSRHLAILREAGIVAAERRGRKVYYRVRYQELAETLRGIAEAIDACCPSASVEGEEQNDEKAIRSP